MNLHSTLPYIYCITYDIPSSAESVHILHPRKKKKIQKTHKTNGDTYVHCAHIAYPTRRSIVRSNRPPGVHNIFFFVPNTHLYMRKSFEIRRHVYGVDKTLSVEKNGLSTKQRNSFFLRLLGNIVCEKYCLSSDVDSCHGTSFNVLFQMKECRIGNVSSRLDLLFLPFHSSR